MAVHLEKPNKYSSPYELWSKVPVKLMAYAVDLKEVYRVNPKGVIKTLKSNLVLKLELGSARVKTEEIRPGQTQLNQFLFLDITESSIDVGATLIARVKSGKHDVCEAVIGRWNQFVYDRVVEIEADLKFPEKEKTKSSPTDLSSRVLGKLVLRLVLTKGTGVADPSPIWIGPGTVPTSTTFTECNYFHRSKELRKSVKTGDLIVYQETGFLGLGMSLATNSPYSRVGMILRLPDKYTGRERPYVIELTSNPTRFLDVVTEEPSSGVVLFRLWERVCSLQGGSIWLLPLLEPLANDPKANMLDFAQRALATPAAHHETLMAPLSHDLLFLLQDIGIKDPQIYCELLSATMCAALLRMGGKRTTELPPLITVATPKDSGVPASGNVFTTPAALITQKDIFGPLVPLRLMENSVQVPSNPQTPIPQTAIALPTN